MQKDFVTRIEVVAAFELPRGVTRQPGDRLTMTMATARGFADKVKILKVGRKVRTG